MLRSVGSHAKSKYLQRFLLAFILLLPGVDPVLRTFIEAYLQLYPRRSAETTTSSTVQAELPSVATRDATLAATVGLATQDHNPYTPPTPHLEPLDLPPTPGDKSDGSSPSLGADVAPDSECESPLPVRPFIVFAPLPEEPSPRYPTPPSTSPSEGHSPQPLLGDSASSSSSQLLRVPSPEAFGISLSAAQPRTLRSQGRHEETEADPLADWQGPPMLTHAGQAYVVLGTLGEGGSGKVMYAKLHTGHSVAIKVVHKAKAYRDRYGRENLVNEKCNWERVTHERRSFLVNLLLSWDDPENVYFVMVSML